MRKWLIVALAALALGGCQNEPVYNVDSRPIPEAARAFPTAKIEAIIVAAGQKRGWTFDHAGEGHLTATQRAPKFQAVLDVYFDQATYRIVRKYTVGLRDKGDTIHPHYNFWVRNLEQDINAGLAEEALRAQ